MSTNANYLMQIFEGMDVPAFLHDSQFRLIFVNHAYCKEAGVTKEAALGKLYWEIFPKGVGPQPNCKLKIHEHGAQASSDEFTAGDKTFLSYEFKIFDENTNSSIYFHVMTNTTQRTLAILSLDKIINQFKILFERHPDAVILLDDQTFVDCNPAAVKIFGCKNRNDILDGNFLKKFSPPLQPDGRDSMEGAAENIAIALKNGSHLFEWTHCRLDGTPFPTEIVLVAFEQNGKRIVQGAIRDISESKAAVDELREVAFKDPLTQLSTRRLFEDRLRQIILKTNRSKQHAALFFIDLDHFKRLNDNFGHLVGDLRLQNVAKGLTASVRSEDTVARLGGDEFVILINELSPDIQIAKPEVLKLADKIVKKLSTQACLSESSHKPCQLEDTSLCHCSASVGVVLFSDNQVSAKELLEQADEAMYKAKNAGGNQFHLYEPDITK